MRHAATGPTRRPRSRPAAAPVAEPLEERALLTAWYVSPAGSDANPGTLAGPLRHIQMAANLAQPGDTVLIRGGVYRETVAPPRSGSAGKPITFRPYNGETVTVSGADVLTGWAAAGGALSATTQPWDLGAGKGQLFMDGRMAPEAAWPAPAANYNPSHPAESTMHGVSIGAGPSPALQSVTITDPALNQPTGWWAGATLRFLPGQQWTASTGTVTSSSPGRLTFTWAPVPDHYHTPTPGNPYSLSGTMHALTAPGEWFRDAAGRLYVDSAAGDAPSRHVVEAKHRPWAFDLSGRSFIVVQGVHLFAAGVTTSVTSHDLTLDRLDARYVSHFTRMDFSGNPPGISGLVLNGTRLTLSNSTIDFSAGDGVFVGGPGNTVTGCTVHDADYAAGDWAGIRAQGAAGQTITNNLVYDTGRSGVMFSYCPASAVSGNTVHDAGLQTTDCGGIYAFGTDGAGAVIASNRVYHVHSAGFGAAGIYLDNGSSRYVIRGNTVYDADYGLKLNPPSRSNLVQSNSLSGSAYSIVGTGDMTGTNVIGNVLSGPLSLGSGATKSGNQYV